MGIGVGITTKATSTSATTVTTGAVTTTSGSTVVLGVVTRNTATFTSIGDNKGNVYTIIGAQLTVGSAAAWARLYRCENIVGGAGHTFNVVVSTGQEITLLVVEITGAATASFDKTASVGDTSSPFTSGATATTTQANELLLGFLGSDSGSNPATHAVSGSTPAAGSWTVQTAASETDGSTLWTGAMATAIVSATGAYEAGFTESGGTEGVVWIATFKEAAGTAPQLQPWQQRGGMGAVMAS